VTQPVQEVVGGLRFVLLPVQLGHEGARPRGGVRTRFAEAQPVPEDAPVPRLVAHGLGDDALQDLLGRYAAELPRGPLERGGEGCMPGGRHDGVQVRQLRVHRELLDPGGGGGGADEGLLVQRDGVDVAAVARTEDRDEAAPGLAPQVPQWRPGAVRAQASEVIVERLGRADDARPR
jgi:hypothetical protein